MHFVLKGLPATDFEHLFGRSDEELKAGGAERLVAGEGFPCRITLEDAPVGEHVLLVHYEHHGADTPYRSSGPIFVREGNHPTAVLDHIPEAMRGRLFSVRAYDVNGGMVDADVAAGSELEPMITTLLAKEGAAYLHLHHARRGCFACRVDRL